MTIARLAALALLLGCVPALSQPAVPETLPGPQLRGDGPPKMRPPGPGMTPGRDMPGLPRMPPFGPGASVELRKGDVSVTVRCGADGVEACAAAAATLFEKASAK